MLALSAFSYLRSVKYAKPALTSEEQKSFLIDRGLKVNSEILLNKLLHAYGFARLDSYCEVFVQQGSRNFRKSTSLSQVWQVIKLDENLRNFLFPYLLRIELAIKAGFIEKLAKLDGPMAYMNCELFHDQTLHVKLVAHATEAWLHSADRQSITFRKRYNETRMPPVWYLTQALSFGAVSKWISNLKKPLSEDLMASLNLPRQRLFVQTGLQGLTVLRNFCAHGGRVWNSLFPVSFAVDAAIPAAFNPQRLAAAMSVVELCLERLELDVVQFRTTRAEILTTVPKWQIPLMGYPREGSK